MQGEADHGGGIDAARRRFGGARGNWLDLSTGINPVPYPLPPISPQAWQALPDADATLALERAARQFWRVPDSASVLVVPGTSALIARLPALAPPGRVRIPGPTYNEHARAFTSAGWTVTDAEAAACVMVQPNNPDGRLWSARDVDAPFAIIDESFADLVPDASLIGLAARPGVVVLKGLGKFWGLGGLRLGFAFGDPVLLEHMRRLLGPWPVSGPALEIGTAALGDPTWAEATRTRLRRDARRLDALLHAAGARQVGGTDLYRLVEVADARRWQERLAERHIWTRRFPYSDQWLRFGLPGREADWDRLGNAMKEMT